jgi:hypothetical protein
VLAQEQSRLAFRHGPGTRLHWAGESKLDVARFDVFTVRDHRRAIKNAGQLAHVARPRVRDEPRERGAAEAPGAHLVPDACEQSARKRRNVALPRAQGWEADDERGNSMKEIFPEFLLRDSLFERSPARRHDAHVDVDRLRASEWAHLPIFYDAEQLDLDARRKIRDLVEKERAAMRLLERARPRNHRAREGAALVAEQLRIRQRLGNGADVEWNVLPRSPAQIMDGASHDVLPGTRLTLQEDGSAESRAPSCFGSQTAHRQ